MVELLKGDLEEEEEEEAEEEDSWPCSTARLILTPLTLALLILPFASLALLILSLILLSTISLSPRSARPFFYIQKLPINRRAAG